MESLPRKEKLDSIRSPKIYFGGMNWNRASSPAVERMMREEIPISTLILSRGKIREGKMGSQLSLHHEREKTGRSTPRKFRKKIKGAIPL